MKTYILIFLFFVFLTGCGGDNKITSVNYNLPPEPDPKINNTTLLGIDSNNNGIRDDIERKIVTQYEKPIEIEIMMGLAKLNQKILRNSPVNALKIEREISKIGDCKMYLRRQGIRINNAIGNIENFTYNTKLRVKKFIQYNKSLGGGAYGSSPDNYNAKACNFNVKQMLKDRK